MAHADIYEYLIENGYNADSIPDSIFDEMESELEQLERDCLDEESKRNCSETLIMFNKKIKQFKKS